MIIVNNIQDATTMKKALSSLVRRSVNFNKDSKDILVELMMMIEDLDKNIEREDRALEAECFEATAAKLLEDLKVA